MEMLLNNSEDKKLFAKTVPVLVTDAYTNHKRKNELFLSIEWQDASTGMYNGKVLEISFTDNNDPFFLYNMRMTSEDFERLSSEQDLRAPFPKLPQFIIDYLETCLREGNNEQPKFFLSFTINEKAGNIARLEIKEDHPFKQLTHLTLEFVAAAESSIRQYIASTFRSLKDKINQLENELAHSERDKKEKLTASKDALYRMKQDLENLRKESKAELAMKERKHSQELQEERDRLLNRLKEEERRFERDKAEKEQYYKKEIHDLQTRVNALDTLNKEIQEKNYKYESTIDELKSKTYSLEDEIKRLKDTVKMHRQKAENLQSDMNRHQSHIKHQGERIMDLEQEGKDKMQTIMKLNQQIESGTRQNRTLEIELDNVKLQLDMSEKARKVLDKDKDELNDIILNLQEKLKKVKSKLELAEKHKKTIEEKDKILQDMKRETEELNIQIESKNSEIRSLSDTVSSLREKMITLEKDVNNKVHLVKWLHRQLTENGITAQYTGRSDLATSPSTIAQRQLAHISSSAAPNAPSAAASSKPTTKSVRNSSNSPVNRMGSSIPQRLPNSVAADSPYGKSSFSNINPMTPDYGVGNHHNMNQEVDFEIDPEAFNAAFGQNGDQIFKHSTAKKSTKPVKSSTPKYPKKR